MNNQLQKFARDTLKAGLVQLPKENQIIFKRMYSHKDLSKPIDKVVDDMPVDQLDWAMTQVQNTIDNLHRV